MLGTSSHLDIEAELSAVTAAVNAASERRLRLEAAIRLTTCIESLASLHEQWSEAIEQQAQSHDRLIELRAMLADD